MIKMSKKGRKTGEIAVLSVIIAVATSIGFTILAVTGCKTIGPAEPVLDSEIDHEWRRDIEVLYYELPRRRY